jgi:hypothetical protein
MQGSKVRGVRVATAWLTGMLLLGAIGTAHAQLSAVSSSNAGSTCTGGNNGDGYCATGAQLPVSAAATFTARYSWNVNADTGVGSTRDESSNATHTVSFG